MCCVLFALIVLMLGHTFIDLSHKFSGALSNVKMHVLTTRISLMLFVIFGFTVKCIWYILREHRPYLMSHKL